MCRQSRDTIPLIDFSYQLFWTANPVVRVFKNRAKGFVQCSCSVNVNCDQTRGSLTPRLYGNSNLDFLYKIDPCCCFRPRGKYILDKGKTTGSSFYEDDLRKGAGTYLNSFQPICLLLIVFNSASVVLLINRSLKGQ